MLVQLFTCQSLSSHVSPTVSCLFHSFHVCLTVFKLVLQFSSWSYSFYVSPSVKMLNSSCKYYAHTLIMQIVDILIEGRCLVSRYQPFPLSQYVWLMINNGLPFYCDIVNISVTKSPITNSESRYECKLMPLMVLLEDFLQWAEIFLSERGSRVYGEVSSHISFYSERLSLILFQGFCPQHKEQLQLLEFSCLFMIWLKRKYVIAILSRLRYGKYLAPCKKYTN